MDFDYFYGRSAEGYQFIMLPTVLIEDECFEDLSIEAKVLYSIYLSRVSLSHKNGWIDKNNRVFIICTIEEIMEKLHCCKQKALDTNSELEKIGLIEKRRQGQGKPNLIYVKNFMSVFKNIPPKSRSLKCRNPEVYKTDFKNPEKQTSRSLKNRPQEVYKTGCNYIENKKIDKSYIEMSHNGKMRGTFQNVILSDEQIELLEEKIPNLDVYIESLSSYIQNTGKKYKDHASTIMSWYTKDKRDGKVDSEKKYTGHPSEYESKWNL